MVRHLLVSALFAVALVPISATAQYPCVCPPVYLPPCPPIIVSGPIYSTPVAGCVPTTGTVVPAQGPTVIPERMEQPKKPQVAAEPPKVMPVKGEELATPRSAEASPKPAEATPPMQDRAIIKPVEVPPVKTPDPLPVVPKLVEPQPEPKKVTPPSDPIPSPAVPPAPPAKPAKGDLGKFDFDLPPLGDAPKPPADQPKLPPVKPEPPKPEAPKPEAAKTKAPEKMNKLPEFEFDLPKVDTGVAQPVEANKPSTSNSSPLANKLAEVEVFPRDGSNVTAAKRGVTFVNKSARDILLTVDGQTTTLPSKMVLKVDLPTVFKWQIGGEPERNEKVPEGSSGIDVVIRK